MNKPTTPGHPISAVLGDEAGTFASLLDQLVPGLDGTPYAFLPLDEMPGSPPAGVNQAYWRELLCRAHWTAAATAIRIRRWLQGLHVAHSGSNLLAAAACARGLIEAAADSHYALASVPLTLARDHDKIQAAVGGTLNVVLLAPELEERLIHFTHARKPTKGETLPPAQVALHVGQYRAALDTHDPRVAECYAMLCDLTHPGASSVLAFAAPEDAEARTVRLSLDAEAEALNELIGTLREILPSVLTLGVNPGLVTLKVLNALPLESLHTPFMDDVNLSAIPAWQKASRYLGAAA